MAKNVYCRNCKNYKMRVVEIDDISSYIHPTCRYNDFPLAYTSIDCTFYKRIPSLRDDMKNIFRHE